MEQDTDIRALVEAGRFADAVRQYRERHGVELPITTQMAEVLSERIDVRTAIDALMLRKQRAEAETG